MSAIHYDEILFMTVIAKYLYQKYKMVFPPVHVPFNFRFSKAGI
jgi:hypothetical protein